MSEQLLPIKAKKTAKKIVLTQSNDLSLVGLPFNEIQYNIWFATVYELNNYRDRIITTETNTGHNFYMVKFNPTKIPGFTLNYNKKQLSKILQNTARLVVSREYGDIIESMPIYTLCRYNYKTQEIEIGINPLLIGKVRQLQGNYTQYFFEEAINIKGKYNKALYIALSCNEYKKNWIVKLEELSEILQYSDSDRLRNLVSKVVRPFYEKTKDNPAFTFEYEPIYKKIGKTRKLTAIRFYNIENKNMKPKGDIVLSMDKDKLFEIFKNEICSILEGIYVHAIKGMSFKSYDEDKKELCIKFKTEEDAKWFSDNETMIMDIYQPTFKKYFPNTTVFYTADTSSK